MSGNMLVNKDKKPLFLAFNANFEFKNFKYWV